MIVPTCIHIQMSNKNLVLTLMIAITLFSVHPLYVNNTSRYQLSLVVMLICLYENITHILLNLRVIEYVLFCILFSLIDL